MKHLIFGAFILLTISIAYGKYWPTQDGATASFNLRVVDDNGDAVSNANVVVWFQKTDEKYEPIRGMSDKDGAFSATAKTIGEVGIGIFKEGYYTTEQKLDFRRISYEEAKKTRNWTGGTSNLTMLLRKKKNPVELSKNDWLQEVFYPATNQVMGFDLKLNDWCSPYGKGLYDDLQMQFEIWQSPTNAWFEYHSRLKITMTNSVDGFYLAIPQENSSFPLEYNADLSATYKKKMVFEYNRTQKKILCSENPLDTSFLIFRTRTKTDDKGNLIAAHYGFIKNGLRFIHGFNYKAAFNPTENDTNLEDSEYWRREELTQQKENK